MGIHLRADPASVPGARAMGISGWITCRRPDCPELLELLLTCARPGAVFVPLDAWPPSECGEETR